MMFEVWLEDRQHLMNIEGKNETDARENFNDDIRFVECTKDDGGRDGG